MIQRSTIVPMRYMTEDGALRVVSVAAPIFASVDENRRLLGWDRFDGEAEQMCDYFPSSGSGQIDVEFHVV